MHRNRSERLSRMTSGAEAGFGEQGQRQMLVLSVLFEIFTVKMHLDVISII